MDAIRKPRARNKRSDYVGVTSDGVRIPRPPRGRGNLSAEQIRKIADGLAKATRPLLQASEERRQRLLEPFDPLDRRVIDALVNGFSEDEAVRNLGLTTRDFERSQHKVMTQLGVNDRSELVDMLFGHRPGTAE